MTYKVLLTGANGFTGVYVRQALLLSGYEVISLVGENPQPEEVVIDLNDLSTLKAVICECQPDFVIHLAALAFVAHHDQEAFYKVNVFGTLNLLSVLAEHSAIIKKIVLASSANVYGTPKVSVISEEETPSPVNHYAMSKLAMECLSKNYLSALPIVYTRPFNYTGIGQNSKFLIPKIIEHFHLKQPAIELGNLHVEREFNDVRMVAEAYVQLMESAAAGTVVNLCSGIGYPLLSVIKHCEEITDQKIDIQVNPALIRPNELPVLIGNPARLNRLIPHLSKYQLKDTLTWMLKN